MGDQYIGEIRIFAGNFAPRGWRFCDGSLIPIQQSTALFALLGTYYGGDGKTNFALPDLRGRAPIHQGQGPGLTPRRIGEQGGANKVALNPAQMPQHNHQAQAIAGRGAQSTPKGADWAVAINPGPPPTPLKLYAPDPTPEVVMNPGALQTVGGNGKHNNVQPALGVNFIIAMEGIFPPRDY